MAERVLDFPQPRSHMKIATFSLIRNGLRDEAHRWLQAAVTA
jgi:hypothetical protein